MSTLVNLLLALVANILSVAGVHTEVPVTSQIETAVHCEYTVEHLNNNLIIKNEQLSQ